MSGGYQLKTEVLSGPACSLCGACLDWCPYLKNIEDHLVMSFDCFTQDGRCYSGCPRTFTDWGKVSEQFLGTELENSDIGPVKSVYKVKGVKPPGGKQDGGTVSTLVKTVLNNKLAEAALITGSDDNLTPTAVLTDDLQEMEKAAGSRFLAAPSMRKLAEAKAKGIKSLVAVGRPCQVQALRKMQFNRPAETPENGVISIGLFCMWSLSWKFKAYLQQEWPGCKVERVAIPQHGLEVTTDQGVKLLATEKARKFIRPGCSYCWDMTSELADISVGAFEAESGWNTVLVRTAKGQELLDLAKNNGELVVEDYPAAELERLKQASFNKKARALKELQTAFENNRLVPFIDLQNACYQNVLARAEGKVNG
ncbi:MAG: Coenzyme F420 hydrogenase/dehydrogenase, beta subunit C-terminal domain [Chitinophagales bacterium]